MYRLLIVDDEPQIVNWLYEIFKENRELDLDVCKAYSGSEALEWLNRARVDIVITDICMPDINGLQLVSEIYANWSYCKVIFLTGYNDFEYIYKAIQHNGVSYLLKTEDDDEIIKAVVKAIEEIEKSLRDEELIIKAKQKMSIAAPLLQKEYILDLLQGCISGEEISQDRFNELEIPMDIHYPVLLLIGIADHFPTTIPYTERLKYIYALDLKTKQMLPSSLNIINVVFDRSNLLWLLQPKDFRHSDIAQLWEKVTVYAKGMLESIQTACKESLNLPVSFALSSEPVSWEAIPERFSSLKQLMNANIGTGSEMILMDNIQPIVKTECSDNNVQKTMADQNKMKLLEMYLEHGDKDEFFTKFNELTEWLRGITSKNYNPALELYYSISLTLLSYINRWGLTEKIAFKIGLNKLTRIDEHLTWSDALGYLCELAIIIFEIQKSEKEKRNDDVILKIQQYIGDHLNEDLSLVKLGEIAFFNPSYLSRFFKQATGSNLSDYINTVKMTKAKELLTRNDLKVHEIATRVGFESAKYFTRFFKKETNMAPQEYRDIFMNK